jgi:plastocyanin
MSRFNVVMGGIALLLAVKTAYAEDVKVVVRDQRGKFVADAVVLAVPVDPKNAQHTKSRPEAVDQVDKQFMPFVKPIYVGSTVRFPNKDNIRHQVYSFSPAKQFELPLYASSEAAPVLFDKPGVVVLGCNIHDWMIGYIYVSETPFFAKTESTGTAILQDLPPGEYMLRIWHPSMERPEEATVKRMNLSADVDVNLEWQLAVKPIFRVPRVSGAVAGYP